MDSAGDPVGWRCEHAWVLLQPPPMLLPTRAGDLLGGAVELAPESHPLLRGAKELRKDCWHLAEEVAEDLVGEEAVQLRLTGAGQGRHGRPEGVWLRQCGPPWLGICPCV